MNIEDFRTAIKGFDESNIVYEEPHFSLRCIENSITKEQVTKIMLDQGSELVRVAKDRMNVYKVYFRLSSSRELKVIVDMGGYKKLRLLTVKILDNRFKIKTIRRKGH